MNSTCFLFSIVLLLLLEFSVCSPVLKRDDIKERNKRQGGLTKAQAAITCIPKFCGICGGGDNHYCCGGPCAASSTCFPSMAKVGLEGGKSVAMAELQIGDKVQSVSPGGRIHYSEVKAFLTKEESVTSWYRSITTSISNTIHLSSNHLVYTRKTSSDKFAPIEADKVLTGDDVLVYVNDELTPEKVTNATDFYRQGAYVPLTEDGNIVVDGVLASCYASFNHDLAHFLMIPIQWYPDMMERIFGVNNGSPEYVNIAKGLGRCILPNAFLFQKSG